MNNDTNRRIIKAFPQSTSGNDDWIERNKRFEYFFFVFDVWRIIRTPQVLTKFLRRIRIYDENNDPIAYLEIGPEINTNLEDFFESLNFLP